MALGNNNFKNNNKSDKKTNNSGTELTVYSSISVTNSESEVDKTSLSFSFWNGLLAVQLNQLTVDAKGITKRDKDSYVSIYLSVPKAMMLSKQITDFIEGTADFIGINTRAACLTIERDYAGSVGPVLIVRKIDEDGSITSAYAYEIRSRYHFALSSLSEENGSLGDFKKKYYDDIELEMIKTQLDEYVRAMTNATAYSVCNQEFKRDIRMEFKINKIAEALNVSFDNGGGYNGGYKKKTGSYFNSGDNLADEDDDSDFGG